VVVELVFEVPDSGCVPEHLVVVLRAMATTSTDAAAAKAAGLTPRTFSRRVAELQRLLHARTRFQIGVQATRLGWI
jgi:hypothetical protein